MLTRVSFPYLKNHGGLRIGKNRLSIIFSITYSDSPSEITLIAVGATQIAQTLGNDLGVHVMSH